MDITGQGRAAPSAGFEVPLEMLYACHGRAQAQCELLQRLLEHLPTHGADTQALEAIERIRRYFDTAARDHHADEEQDLLPALLEAMAGSDAVCIRDITRRVHEEHRQLERHGAALREALQAIEQGSAGELDPSLARKFIDAYGAHIAFEEAEVLPMAQRLLGDDQLEAVGRAMRLRRGIADPR